MTETLAGMSSLKKTTEKFRPPAEVEHATIQQLVKAARERGDDLTGPDGLLKQLTKTVLETALDEEMTEHLGYGKHAVEGRDGGNSRRHPVEDGADRQCRAGAHRGAARPRRQLHPEDRR